MLGLTSLRGCWTGTAAAAAAATLAVGGCTAADTSELAELEAQIAPDGGSAAPGDDPEIRSLAFDPESFTCAPPKERLVSGRWETSAPRLEVEDPPVELGLRDVARVDHVSVKAEVGTPEGTWHEATSAVSGSAWTEVAFPEDFAPPHDGLDAGVYTVVWSIDGEGARTFLSCDGFAVE